MASESGEPATAGGVDAGQIVQATWNREPAHGSLDMGGGANDACAPGLVGVWGGFLGEYGEGRSVVCCWG